MDNPLFNNKKQATGGMSEGDVSREVFPAWFAIADALGGAVRPFDVYQGPYIFVPHEGRLFIISDEDNTGKVWNEDTKQESGQFMLDDEHAAVDAALEVLAVQPKTIRPYGAERQEPGVQCDTASYYGQPCLERGDSALCKHCQERHQQQFGGRKVFQTGDDLYFLTAEEAKAHLNQLAQNKNIFLNLAEVPYTGQPLQGKVTVPRGGKAPRPMTDKEYGNKLWKEKMDGKPDKDWLKRMRVKGSRRSHADMHKLIEAAVAERLVWVAANRLWASPDAPEKVKEAVALMNAMIAGKVKEALRDEQPQYVVKRDGVIKTDAMSYTDCVRWVHNNYSGSLHSAIKNEGYSIDAAQPGDMIGNPTFSESDRDELTSMGIRAKQAAITSMEAWWPHIKANLRAECLQEAGLSTEYADKDWNAIPEEVRLALETAFMDFQSQTMLNKDYDPDLLKSMGVKNASANPALTSYLRQHGWNLDIEDGLYYNDAVPGTILIEGDRFEYWVPENGFATVKPTAQGLVKNLPNFLDAATNATSLESDVNDAEFLKESKTASAAAAPVMYDDYFDREFVLRIPARFAESVRKELERSSVPATVSSFAQNATVRFHGLNFDNVTRILRDLKVPFEEHSALAEENYRTANAKEEKSQYSDIEDPVCLCGHTFYKHDRFCDVCQDQCSGFTPAPMRKQVGYVCEHRSFSLVGSKDGLVKKNPAIFSREKDGKSRVLKVYFKGDDVLRAEYIEHKGDKPEVREGWDGFYSLTQAYGD